MTKNTNENGIKQKLKYLNLDLENIPEFLYEYISIEYRPRPALPGKEQIIYKHVPINKIQILLTPNTRSAELRNKYSDALPLFRYLKLGEGPEFERYTQFLNMLNNMSIEEIEEIEEKQEKLSKGVPFDVKYSKSYLWEIYYSQVSDIYFMLVPIEDIQYNYFFYLLKKQIEFYNSKSKVAPKIFVPITNLPYSRERLNEEQVNDIENYLWIFTSNWPHIYEVYDKKNQITMGIIGEANLYDGIKTKYKVKLATHEEAQNFYKELKAFFILKTELSEYYNFEIKIDKNSILSFYYNDEKLSLEKMPEFIKSEYKKVNKNLINQSKSNKKMMKLLNNMREDEKEKEREFLEKERQIATFLEYKKTFFGKMKIFFSGKKSKVKKKNEKIEIIEEIIKKEKVTEKFGEDKAVYTIEDLVVIYDRYDREMKEGKNLELDVEALDRKLMNLDRKIKNATIYIAEIEKHKKSIFEFWKFANKDELPALAEGETQNDVQKKLKKVFNFEFDFEALGKKVDKIQREKLTKEEINSLYLTSTQALNAINLLRQEQPDNKELKKVLDTLKKELNEELVGDIDFDIFGSMNQDRTQIKMIADKQHRENKRSSIRILNLNKKETLEDFEDKIKNCDENIKSALSKMKSSFEISLYKISTEDEISENSLEVFNLDAVTCLENYKNKDEKEVNLYKINIHENMPIAFFSNIVLYENYNKTLPLGMNLSTNVLLDTSLYKLSLKNKKVILTNMYSNNQPEDKKLVVKTINVFEYDVELA